MTKNPILLGSRMSSLGLIKQSNQAVLITAYTLSNSELMEERLHKSNRE